jgi:hypothetical protein
MTGRPRTDVLLAVLLLAAGTALCLHYGRRGILGVDQSIVFDGAYRVLGGQVPYRDFVTPNGLVPIYLQAGVFSLLGVTWFAYCLHAALFNGLSCLTVHLLLRTLGATRLVACFYGLLSGVVMYPPFGVPFMDQHAAVLTLLSLLVAVAALRADEPRRAAVLWMLLPAALFAAYWSKQIPTAFAVPLIALLVLCSGGGRRRAALRPLGVGAGALVGLVALLVAIGRVDLGWLWEYHVEIPSRLGAARFEHVLSWAHAFPQAASYPSTWCLDGGAVLLAVTYLLARALPRSAWLGPFRAVGLQACLLLGLALIMHLSMGLTRNQPQNSLGYLFAGVGVMHVALTRVLEAMPRSRARVRAWSAALSLLLFGVCAVDAFAFNRDVNATRVVHRMYDPQGFRDTPQSSPAAMRFLQWGTTELPYEMDQESLATVVEFLAEHPGNIYLYGDYSILYGLTGRPSVSPVLWYDGNLTLPEQGTPQIADFEERLLGNILMQRVRYIVVENRGPRLADLRKRLPRLRALIDALDRRVVFTNAHYAVLELDRPG